MVWQKQLRTASFRGIRFNLTGVDTALGRRSQTHEFVRRDIPYTEDMGRKARQYSIDAFINGEDYLRDKQRLITACEAEGAGVLVHPYYGNIKVFCTDCQVRESGRNGGVAEFKLSFVEAGSLLYPEPKQGRNGFIGTIADALKTVVNTTFNNEFGLDNYPEFLTTSAAEKVGSFVDLMEDSISFINANADEMADLSYAITNLRDDIDEVINTPAVLANRIQNSINLISEAVTEPRESLKAYKDLFGFGGDDVNSNFDTPSRQQEIINKNNLNYLIRATALSNALVSASSIDYQSNDDAELDRDTLLSEIDTLLLEVLNDDLYQSLQDLKSALIENVPSPDEKLPDIYTLTKNDAIPSLVLAHDLYESLDLEGDLINRNKVKNPLYIPGGVELKALTKV